MVKIIWNEKRQNRLNELELKHPGDLDIKEQKELARLQWIKDQVYNK